MIEVHPQLRVEVMLDVKPRRPHPVELRSLAFSREIGSGRGAVSRAGTRGCCSSSGCSAGSARGTSARGPMSVISPRKTL